MISTLVMQFKILCFQAESTVQRLRLRIDEMTARIVDVDQKCESQAQEINNLQEENLRLHRQNEGIAILQAQVVT